MSGGARVEPVYYLAAWRTPKATSNSAAKRIFHEREKSLGSPDEAAQLRSRVLALLGADATVEQEMGMLLLGMPDSRLRESAQDLLALIAEAGCVLYDPQVGRLVVPMTTMAAPWPPEWTGPIAELREGLARLASSGDLDDGAPHPAPPARATITMELPPPDEMTERYEEGLALGMALAAEMGWEVKERPADFGERGHVAPELEALVPAGLVDSKQGPTSVRATDYGAPTINRALKVVGVRPRDAVVVDALGGKRDQVHTVTIIGVPGVGAEALAAAFEPAIFKPRSVRWQKREIAGRVVAWAEGKLSRDGEPFTAAWWACDGLVLWITGQPAWLEAAIQSLPSSPRS